MSHDSGIGWSIQSQYLHQHAEAVAHCTCISVKNPPGMAYPVTEDERYITVALASCDGQALAECERAVLSAVSTSFNTGFSLDVDKPLPEFHGAEVKDPGTLPGVVARVGATVTCDAVDGMSYVMRDYEMNVIGQGTVVVGRLVIPAEKPVFFVELTREVRE